MIRVALPVLLATLLCGAAAPRATDSFAERAVTCRLAVGELAALPGRIHREIADPGKPVRHMAAPTGDVYRTVMPVSAFGNATREIYLAPARVLLVVDRPLAAVTGDLGLRAVPFSPWAKSAGAGRSIIAYELHQDGLQGRTLVGCEYRSPEAAGWFSDGLL